ncbi:multidrug resistance-associated ABC transporter [Amylocystis lapponica]|nr:multidrug resistance-associated ABC transporter [Amylocystis lapponica]
MLQYQLPVAIALAVCVACSITIFAVSRPSEGAVKLPTHADQEEFPQSDPFDVTKPEDLIDGTPLNPDAFWAKMRMRKLAVSVVLTLIIIIQGVCLGWSAVEGNRSNTTAHILHAVFALYTLLVAIRAVNQEDRAHEASVIHLSVLTFFATSLLFATAILPSSQSADVNILESPAVPIALWYATLALYFVSLVIAATTPCGPPLHFPAERIYSDKILMSATLKEEGNVCGVTGASVWDTLLFSYTTKVVILGNIAESLEIGDLPIVPLQMRGTAIFAGMRAAMRYWHLRIGSWRPTPGSGTELGYRLVRLNKSTLIIVVVLACVSAVLFYVPALFLQRVVLYLEIDPERENRGWGWVYCVGLFASNAVVQLTTGQLWSLSTTTLQVRLRIQLNSILFAKTLVRKDVASSAAAKSEPEPGAAAVPPATDGDEAKKDEEDEFSSKAQIMTLMTTDVDRVSEFSYHLFTIIDSPIEVVIGTIFLYSLLGVSCFFGLAVTCLFLPLNHFAGKVIVGAQDNLMKARDERVGLMNEILGGIRMLKFMAWERSFEAGYSKSILFSAIWNASPILVTLISFWHFAVIRKEVLTLQSHSRRLAVCCTVHLNLASMTYNAVLVFNEMKYALNALPETFINMLQVWFAIKIASAEVDAVPPLDGQPHAIALQSATVTWPQDRTRSSSAAPSAASTPKHKFILMDLSLDFPLGELSLICGKLGSGKSLLLLALLGEADLLTGQLTCPRSPPDTIASFTDVVVSEEEWIVQGVCAFVPQTAWLRNASIRDNILFNLPYIEERYQKTLEVCALQSDLRILEDGDMSEIGERGVNLSGGQKARVSLARAVYSRASILLLDDVLSAVDAHTAHHLYHECLKGDLMRGRTVILVSHHVQLCVSGASYIVALDNGRVQFQGDQTNFRSSGVLNTLVQSGAADPADDKAEPAVHDVDEMIPEKEQSNATTERSSETSSTVAATTTDVVTADPEAKPEQKKAPRKLIEEEKRAVGRISKDIWATYISAAGGYLYWATFAFALGLAAISPVLENGWLRIWTGAGLELDDPRSPLFYISVYGAITAVGVVLSTVRWAVITAAFMLLQFFTKVGLSSHLVVVLLTIVLSQELLEGVLFANIRFHDTVSRGRLLNRFGKDFEGIDSSLPDHFGRSVAYALSAGTTFVTITAVGGVPFLVAAVVLGLLYYNVGKVYGQTSRDMRRLDSVTRSPLYSIYGETISGVTVVRAFGASSKFLRDMLRSVDTNSNPYYWMWGVNRWLSARFNLLSSAVVGVTGFIAILSPNITASTAGFALAFANTITGDLLFLVRRFVGLEQSMVAVERIKEFSELQREPPEFIEPRPPASWPASGAVVVEDLVIRYAPELPNVLHHLNFEIKPGEKVGVLGRTGSGKSTLALSFFRFVEPTEGRILVDGLDISQIGLTDLRSKLTIIPQDPTILSGTLRSTLDVFNEYQDAEIYEALRRVHLIPPSDTAAEDPDSVNMNVFRNLDSAVSEGGENFSTGEKQLLCMARAILKRSKVLLMDEATASVDYATDELIGKTIRHEFAESTIMTIAHRLRTVIDYDKVMLLEEGRIAEFDTPGKLLADRSSKFHSLCKATGNNEFAMLKKMAGVP